MASRPPRRTQSPWIRPRRRLADDEAGSFVVLEAVLVALLVLTAILFFTSVQRPSTGADQGGIDLAQVAADTLSILQTHTFEGQEFDEWTTSLAQGDPDMAAEVDEFLDEILPTGARYSLRVDNGASSLVLLPQGSGSEPKAARAAQVLFLPSWSYYAAKTATDAAAPGQLLTTTTNPTLAKFIDSTQVRCIKGPFGPVGDSTTVENQAGTQVPRGSLGPGGSTWVSLWQSVSAAGSRSADSDVVDGMDGDDVSRLDAGMPVTGTGIPGGTTVAEIVSSTSIRLSQAATVQSDDAMSFTRNRVPAGAPYGTWVGYSLSDCTGTEYVAKVWSPRFRTIADGQLAVSGPLTLLNSASAGFTTLDLGLPVLGPGIPENARIVTILSTTSAVISPGGPATAASQPFQLPVYSQHAGYALQLVVWFGA